MTWQNTGGEGLREHIDESMTLLKKHYLRTAQQLLDLGATPDLVIQSRIEHFAQVGVDEFSMEYAEAKVLAEEALASYEHVPTL